MRNQFPCKSSRATRRRGGPLRMLASTEAGFTIVEVVVSAVLVALIAGGTATALVSSGNYSGDQRRRSQAAEIAQQDQERMRGLSAKALSGYSQTRTVTLDGVDFTVLSQGQFLSSAGASSCNSSGNGAAAYILITSDVTWAASTHADVTSNGSKVVREQSLITPPTGGTMLVNLKDETNTALSGVTVTATGPNPSSATEVATTGSEGCVVFGAMDTGDYNITVAKGGYVDPDGDATPSPVPIATVSGSGTSYPNANPIQLGQAGRVSAAFTANNGALSGQHAPSLSVSNAGRATPLVTTPASPGTPITTTFSLFPFTTAYNVWAGKCPGNQPPTANLITSTVGRGATATPVVKEPALDVRVQYPSGTNVKPAGMKLYYSQSAGGTCSESWTPAINAAAGPAPPTNGWLASPGQPYAGSTTVGSTTYNGSYNVCASYNTGAGGVRYGMNIGQANTNFTAATVVTVPISATNQFTSTYISGSGSCP
jgi:type II secretory pathway pseudopilin PulG